MVKISKTLIVCMLFITVTGCVIYRTRLFEPFNYIEESAYSYTVDRFDNWDIEVEIRAYKTMGGIDPEANHDFYIEIEASTSTSGIKPYNVKYTPTIKNIKILYGEGLQHEIVLPENKQRTHESDLGVKRFKSVFLTYKDIYIPHEIKFLTVVSEMEFLDENGNVIVKKFTIPMKRVESKTLGIPVI